MPKHFSSSHMKSQLRQVERKATSQWNNAVRKLNSDLKRDINRAANSALRKYNSQIQHNRQIIKREIAKLNSSPTIHVQYSTTVTAMQCSYDRVMDVYDSGADISPEQFLILDYVEREQANSLIATNRLFNNTASDETEDDIEDVTISDKLEVVSDDLMNRWRGAVFALNPKNPDAARQFCTSAREIFTEFIEMKAPDKSVFSYNPNAAKTERGNATRKEKIKYMMHDKGMDDSVIDFAEADITNILELFHVLSDGTHGEAGRYKFDALVQVKRRVQQGINFLCAISA